MTALTRRQTAIYGLPHGQAQIRLSAAIWMIQRHGALIQLRIQTAGFRMTGFMLLRLIKGSIWFGTEGGLAFYDGSKWKNWNHKDGLGAPYEKVKDTLTRMQTLPRFPNTTQDKRWSRDGRRFRRLIIPTILSPCCWTQRDESGAALGEADSLYLKTENLRHILQARA